MALWAQPLGAKVIGACSQVGSQIETPISPFLEGGLSRPPTSLGLDC